MQTVQPDDSGLLLGLHKVKDGDSLVLNDRNRRFKMRLVADYLQKYLTDHETSFVFPSEVAAAFWRRKALSLTAERAVRSDRFLSWDTFKERMFAVKGEAAPVNSLMRICFSSDLLARNAKGAGFIKALILPEHAGSWRPFVRTIARMLPELEQLLNDGHASALLRPRLRQDLESINREYKSFLSRHRLFEPVHQIEPLYRTAGAETTCKSVLFFPDVILDFAEYRNLAERNATVVKEKLRPRDTRVVVYPNARIEVKQTCLSCRKLLDSGVAPGSIAVTLTDSRGYWEELGDQANCYDIPLVQRLGNPLAEYGEVRIYKLLSDVAASGFSITALKELFLNSAFPWRDSKPARGLIRFGIENYGIQNIAGGKIDEWQRRLKIAGREELLGFYLRLRQSATAMIESPTFADLRAAVMAFNHQFLDTARFSEQQRLPFSAAIDLLSRIENAAAHLEGLRLDSPFSLWMLALQERQYVRQTGCDGIPVYDYRVAAGIYPEHHFILGLSQEASAVTTSKYRFLPLNMLPVDVREAGDFAGSFLRLYEHSGREVTMSSANEGFEGPATAVRSLPSTVATSTGPGAYGSEIRFWSGSDTSMERTYRVQRSGLEYIAGTGLQDKGIDLTRKPIEKPTLATSIPNRLFGEGEAIALSPTNLDMWKQCKFRYLLRSGLKLEEIELDTVYTDPREMGILFHRLFAEALRTAGLQAATGNEDPIRAVVLSVFSSWVGTRFLAPVRNDLWRRAEQSLRLFLESDRCMFHDTRVHSLEDTLAVAIGNTGVYLNGRIDRISVRDDCYIVVDYKSRLWRKRSGVVNAAGELFSFQIPAYVLLVEGNYGPVSEALYYDIDKAAFETVVGGKSPWFDEEAKEELLRQTIDTVSAMARAIAQCEYQTPESECDPCEYRPICREKYRVR